MLRSTSFRGNDRLCVALLISLKLALAWINHPLRLVHDEHARRHGNACRFTLSWLFIVHLGDHRATMIVLVRLCKSVGTWLVPTRLHLSNAC